MKLEYPVGETRIIRFRGEAFTITYCDDGLWRDADGGVYALPDKKYDPKDNKAGYWIFSLSAEDPLSSMAAAVHDYQYSCSQYQKAYTRLESDRHLQSLIKQIPGWRRHIADPFYYLARFFGSFFWENPKTR